MKQKLKLFLTNFEEIIAGTFLIATTLLVLINVFMRYFLRTGLYWSEEVATGCFVWSVFIGAAAGFKHKMHVGIDMLVEKLKPQPRYFVRLLVDLIQIFINGYIAMIALQYLKISARKPTPVLGISSATISSSIFVGFTLMTLYSLIFIYRDLKDKPVPKEGPLC